MYSHHPGSWLLSSSRSPSHTCPCDSALAPGLRPRDIQMTSAKHAAMLNTTRIKMYHSQNLLVKSAMVFLPAMGGQVQVVVVLERLARGGVEIALAPTAPGPRPDADEQNEQEHRPDRMRNNDVHGSPRGLEGGAEHLQVSDHRIHLGLALNIFGCGLDVLVRVRMAEDTQHRHLFLDQDRAQLALRQPPVPRHHRLWPDIARVQQVPSAPAGRAAPHGAHQ